MNTAAFCLRLILNRLTQLTLIFYAVVLIGGFYPMPDIVMETFKTAGNLSLGALLTIIKDIANDKDEEVELAKKKEKLTSEQI